MKGATEKENLTLFPTGGEHDEEKLRYDDELKSGSGEEMKSSSDNDLQTGGEHDHYIYTQHRISIGYLGSLQLMGSCSGSCVWLL
jgi:hypothetical protein